MSDLDELIAEARRSYEDTFNVPKRERDLIRRLTDALGEIAELHALCDDRLWGVENHAERMEVERDAAVAAKALEDAARAFDGGTISLDVFSNELEKSYWRVANEQRSILVDSLRARAAEYRKEQGSD